MATSLLCSCHHETFEEDASCAQGTAQNIRRLTAHGEGIQDGQVGIENVGGEARLGTIGHVGHAAATGGERQHITTQKADDLPILPRLRMQWMRQIGLGVRTCRGMI